MELNLEVQLNANLQAAILLLRVSSVVQIGTSEKRFLDIRRAHGLDLFIACLGEVLELVSSSQGRGCRVVEEGTS
jgi:hypothetical protein